MNPIKPSFKTEILPIVLVLASVLISFYFYSTFPDIVPIHWNIAGEPDNWSTKFNATLYPPLVMLGLYILFLLLPYLDPQKARYAQFKQIYHIFKNVLLIFLLAIFVISGLNSLGYNLPIEIWIPVMVGTLFIVLGNYLSKIKPNWFVGIRTPWTLSNEEVWNKTHRAGGKIFILGGILMMLMPALRVSWRLPVFIVMIIMVVAGTIGYSYIVYLRENKQKNGSNQ